MALSDLFTTAQLEIACGGADRLMRLSKARNRSDDAYTGFIAEVRAAAQADAYGLAKIAVDPLDDTVPASGMMQQSCLACAVYWAHYKGSGGQEIPDQVREARTGALDSLRELRDGGRTLDTEGTPTSNAGATLVSLNSTRRLSRTNSGGFC